MSAGLRLALRNFTSTIVVVLFLIVACPQPAHASWLVDDDDGFARARGVSMPIGPAVSASVLSDDVTLSWPAVTLPGSVPVQGYLVTRYTTTGASVSPNATCSGVITSLSCVEVDVAAGTWTYSVRAIKGGWRGAEGTRSGAVTTFVADLTPPQVSDAALIKTLGGSEDVIRQGGAYYVYASAADVGSPQSGVATVTANVNSITTGSTAVPLVAGSYTVNGVTYSHRSDPITASNPLTAGAKTISFTAIDQAGNSGVLTGYPVTVDNTPPAIVDVQAINGGVVGKADTGDRIVLTYSEPIDANSILPGWDGTSTIVAVRLQQATSFDRIRVYNGANTTLTKLGTVRLSSPDYVTATVSFTGSTMVRTGSTITVTLGTTIGITGTVTVPGAMRWTPVVGAVDFGGNALPTTFLNEPGASDIDL